VTSPTSTPTGSPPPTSSTPVIDAVGAFVAGAATAAFDDHVRELARRHVLDTVASIVACQDLAAARVARRYALAASASADGTAILGTDDRVGLVDAVFASAMAGHGAEINDFVPSVFVQPGPAVVAAALCLAERHGRSGDAVVRAVIAGYELAVRVPRALGTANLRRAGLANHGIGPTFGAAAAAASLLGLPAARVRDLLSCCAQQASGSWQWLLDVEHVEKAFVFAGIGARNGVQAALLVEVGYRGVPGCLDDPAGWLRSGAFRDGDADPEALVRRLDSPYALTDTGYKRHPVGGPAQPAVEALLALLAEVGPGEVRSVEIAMPGRAAAFRDAAMPALNLRYLAALILTDGRLDFAEAQSLHRMHGDERIAARMATVEVVHDPAQETGTGRGRAESARVRLTLHSGAVAERFVPHVAGYPTHPLLREQVEAKALDLLAPRLGPGRAREVVDACRHLDHLADAGELVALLRT
jgi:2-methylcitrate dehydratase PrpD